MRFVQLALFVGWLTLIASLFWDPLTPWLTDPANHASPFRVKNAGMVVRGEMIPNDQYAMGARIWWAMLVPIVPLFLMVFGHEAWRRICPLSFASQIPRRLGLQRKKDVVQRRTGTVEKTVVFVKRQGWLQRNTWYVQFGLLWLGLNARLIFVNSDRIALGLFLLGIITAAIVVGYLYGGKTWCNYICPVNVVQKIYTEPRGIFESAPHVTRPGVSQSMCRTPAAKGSKGPDTPACVACTSNCGDVDLERSYWESISNPQRRHVYYMFWGLIIGFYGYYYLYSGDWNYYFSGIWTHEKGVLDRILAPGFFIAGVSIPVPKLIAAPMTLALSCAVALGFGLGMEKAYRKLRVRMGPVSEAEVLNHCLSVSAFVSINTFYAYGGRPNLLLLPDMALRAVDLVVVVATLVWLFQATQRTPMKFRREGMASSLLQQLKRLRVDVAKYLDGRTLEQLKPDEVYVLTKVLPAFSRQQKMDAYRQILEDAINTGKTRSHMSLSLLHEMRLQMDISDEEHTQLVEALGAEAELNPPAQHAPSQEKLQCLKNYTDILGQSVTSFVEGGGTLRDAMQDADLIATATLLRASFQITQSEHDGIAEHIGSHAGPLPERLAIHLATVRDLLSSRFCMDSYAMNGPHFQSISQLLVRVIDGRIEDTLTSALSLLRALADIPDARWHAASLASMAGERMRKMLERPFAPGCAAWHEELSPELVRILASEQTDDIAPHVPRPEGLVVHSFRDVIRNGVNLPRNLHYLASIDDEMVQALVITAFQDFEPRTARSLAEQIRKQATVSDGMLAAVIEQTLNGTSFREATSSRRLRIGLQLPDEKPRALEFTKPIVSVGRAADNDITIASPLLSDYHLTIEQRSSTLQVRCLGDDPFYVDDRKSSATQIDLTQQRGVISFAELGSLGPQIELISESAQDGYVVDPTDALTRLLWLSNCEALDGLTLPALNKLAMRSEVRSYDAGMPLRDPDSTDCAVYVIRTGELWQQPHGKVADDNARRWQANDLVEDIELGAGQLVAGREGVRVLVLKVDDSPVTLLSLPRGAPENGAPSTEPSDLQVQSTAN